MTKRILFLMILGTAPAAAAEFLINNHTNYWDKLDAREVAAAITAGKLTQDEYDRRSRIGDVIDVKPDGFWTGPNPKYKSGPELDTKLFRIVSVPGMSVDEARKYTGPGTTAKHKFSITAGAEAAVTTIQDIETLSVTDKDKVAKWNERKDTVLACAPGSLLLGFACLGFCRYRRR